MTRYHQKSGSPVGDAYGILKVLPGGLSSEVLNEGRAPKPDQNRATVGAGLYSWDISSNIVRGDAGVAGLFDLDPIEVQRGLPIQSFIARLHTEDRGPVVASLRTALLTSIEFNEQYRIVHDDGTSVIVSGIGHVFRNADDEPITWVGIVHPSEPANEPSTLVWQCLSAYTTAQALGQDQVAKKLLDVLAGLQNI